MIEQIPCNLLIYIVPIHLGKVLLYTFYKLSPFPWIFRLYVYVSQYVIQSQYMGPKGKQRLNGNLRWRIEFLVLFYKNISRASINLLVFISHITITLRIIQRSKGHTIHTIVIPTFKYNFYNGQSPNHRIATCFILINSPSNYKPMSCAVSPLNTANISVPDNTSHFLPVLTWGASQVLQSATYCKKSSIKRGVRLIT